MEDFFGFARSNAKILRASCKSPKKRVLVATVFLAVHPFQAVASPLFLNDSDTLGSTEKYVFFRVEMILQFAQLRLKMPQVVMSYPAKLRGCNLDSTPLNSLAYSFDDLS